MSLGKPVATRLRHAKPLVSRRRRLALCHRRPGGRRVRGLSARRPRLRREPGPGGIRRQLERQLRRRHPLRRRLASVARSGCARGGGLRAEHPAHLRDASDQHARCVRRRRVAERLSVGVRRDPARARPRLDGNARARRRLLFHDREPVVADGDDVGHGLRGIRRLEPLPDQPLVAHLPVDGLPDRAAGLHGLRGHHGRRGEHGRLALRLRPATGVVDRARALGFCRLSASSRSGRPPPSVPPCSRWT